MDLTTIVPFVYLDANVVIRAFEGEVAVATPILTFLIALQDHARIAVTSELTLAEVLAPVKLPGARTVADRIILYDAVFGTGLIQLIPVSRVILRETALLRQSHPQKLPDAIQVATALQARCPYLMSGDKGLERLPPSLRFTQPDAAGIASIMEALRA